MYNQMQPGWRQFGVGWFDNKLMQFNLFLRDSQCGSARMYSFLGDLFSMLLSFLMRIPRRIVAELGQAWDGFRMVLGVWLDEALEPPQPTIAASQSSAGPPRDWLTQIQSWLRLPRLIRVRVPTRRSSR